MSLETIPRRFDHYTRYMLRQGVSAANPESCIRVYVQPVGGVHVQFKREHDVGELACGYGGEGLLDGGKVG